MADEMGGGPIGDLGGPDLGAVGNAARVSKKSTTVPQELSSFSVKKGDNGGVTVCETYERKAPEGRRASSFLGGGDYKENPFGPDDGAKAAVHITGLLSEMGVRGAAPAPVRPPVPSPAPRPPMAPPQMAPPRPTAAVARGPNGAGAVVQRPGGGGAGLFRGPNAGY